MKKEPAWERIEATDWYKELETDSPEVKEERSIWRTAVERTFDEPEFIEAVLDNVWRERMVRDIEREKLEDAKTPKKGVSASGTDT